MVQCLPVRKEDMMAGYFNYSMSNNAVSAYEDGEKPLSRWSKKDIMAEIKKQVESGELTLCCDISRIQKTPLEVMKENEKGKEEERWKCSFLEWSWKGKHKRAKRMEGTGTVKGMWFTLPDGRKKKTTATGFEFLVKLWAKETCFL